MVFVTLWKYGNTNRATLWNRRSIMCFTLLKLAEYEISSIKYAVGIAEKCCVGITSGYYFLHNWWRQQMKCSFYPPGTPWMAFDDNRSCTTTDRMCYHSGCSVESSWDTTEQCIHNLKLLFWCNRPGKYQSPTIENVSTQTRLRKMAERAPVSPVSSFVTIGRSVRELFSKNPCVGVHHPPPMCQRGLSTRASSVSHFLASLWISIYCTCRRKYQHIYLYEPSADWQQRSAIFPHWLVPVTNRLAVDAIAVIAWQRVFVCEQPISGTSCKSYLNSSRWRGGQCSWPSQQSRWTTFSCSETVGAQYSTAMRRDSRDTHQDIPSRISWEKWTFAEFDIFSYPNSYDM